ncbi:MAG: DUF115 domain-containing protein [Candidatus Thermoplasmatota archaeon]|nr:DUF115 domain-containing protein [Candidatus Thermoplasmatota archaeon]MBS3789344.1 DUF115 domain-containing protein [Candidatus Thermoplasmatota archaeon]
MDFEDWEPLYEEIISNFGYSKKKDRISADILVESRSTDSLSPLKDLKNKTVEIGGPYFSESDIETTVAAGASVRQMVDKGVDPDLMVTDLDGDNELQLDLNLEGVPAVIHAHGDNIKRIEEWAEKFEGCVISTCQCRPPKKGIYNFGGFTDGDRACFLADHFGAEKIVLNGWDFSHPFGGANSEKLKKLKWAERLIGILNIKIDRI